MGVEPRQQRTREGVGDAAGRFNPLDQRPRDERLIPEKFEAEGLEVPEWLPIDPGHPCPVLEEMLVRGQVQ